MLTIDSCSLKKNVPILIALLLVAQVDLASAFEWPQSLLSLLHLTAANNDLCSGVCAGLGTSIDVLVIFQLVRMWAKRAMRLANEAEHS
jgi:cytochrome c oxidase assembly factor CtaG